MTTGRILTELRKEKEIGQKELAVYLNVSVGTVSNYENDVHSPDLSTLCKLADFFGVSVNYLLTEDEEFVVEASEQYGSRGMKQAQELIDGMSGLFAGGTLSDQDKDAVMKALQDIYWESKARNVEKYTPKKFKKTETDAE